MEPGVCELMLTLEPFRCLDAVKARLGRAGCVSRGLSLTSSSSPESTHQFSPTWISSLWVNTYFCLFPPLFFKPLTAFLSSTLCWRRRLDWSFPNTWQGQVSPLLSIRARSKDWPVCNQVFRKQINTVIFWNCQMRSIQGARVDTWQ